MRTYLGRTTAVLLLTFVCLPVAASTITFVTPTGSTVSGQPVSASATFTTGTDSVMITLSNLQANPGSIEQVLSDLSFTLSGSFGITTLVASSGTEVTVFSDGTYTLGPSVVTGWNISGSGSTIELTELGTAVAPAQTIIGPPGPTNTYSSANLSIAGNAAHNPFLFESATFDLSVAGVTADTTITGATFSFSTLAGSEVAGVIQPTPPTGVPEPGTVVLLGTGIVVLSMLRRCRA